MSAELPKAYDPALVEEKWAKFWAEERLFDVSEGSSSARSGAPFVQLLPPPNVTGRLHMGHMLNQTEMDILARWHRMRGDTSMWVPGTDHAGIATQMMVERQLAAEGKTSREELGREAFTERVWQWKEQYGGAITEQMRRLGASVDWSREYFTMDERLSNAVRAAFVRLWDQGLIYRGAYIVNWDPQIQTAVSDLEVESEERAGSLFHIRYDFADGSGSIVIATTRPETLLGDTAVVVNPADERYAHLVGKSLLLPLVGREIPLLADDWAQPEFGTGAVKVTPAHDPNDFTIGQRHGLASPLIMDTQARISVEGSPYDKLDRFEARKRIVADLEAAGHLIAVKDHTLTLPISQRTGAVIEPRLSMQWFLAVNKAPVAGEGAAKPRSSIAENAVAAVREGHIRFTPEMYKKIYNGWMENIHDWCISRQLWWGHRIPAWYCGACGKMTVALDAPAACSGCGITDIRQETDVLDTWFSSALLPFTVFGWDGSDKLTADLAAFYPTQLLVTGFDILFFWVARMIMLGCHFMLDVPLPDGSARTLADAVPFREVYIHALVRDANREKMSKTKGNVVDPIEVVKKYGTDAVRFTLASQASPGTDIAFSEGRTEGYRAFANKIWNAARFLQLQIERGRDAGYTPKLDTTPGAPRLASETWDLPSQTPLETRWIVARLHTVSTEVERALRNYRFDDAANAVYQFFWGGFCDWYLELVKLRLDFTIPKNDTTALTLNALLSVFECALRLLSPFMPFITEELWHALHESLGESTPAKSISLTSYPQPADFAPDMLGMAQMGLLQTVIVGLRSHRKEQGVPEKELVPGLTLGIRDYTLESSTENLITQNADMIKRLAKVSSIEIVPPGDPRITQYSWVDGYTAIVYERQVDIPAERERLTKDLAKFNKGLEAAEKQLSNEGFIARAPSHIVDGLRKQAAETLALRDKAQAALNALPPG